MNNFLYDREASQITAILDFDWAQIGLQADEILRSFDGRYARFPGPYEQDPDRVLLRHALLNGFPSPLPASSRSVRWDIAEMWDSQLAEVGAKRPSTLEGIEPLSHLYMLLDIICPDIEQRSRTTVEREKEVAEELLEKFLQENQT
jgi:hypothetical protein